MLKRSLAVLVFALMGCGLEESLLVTPPPPLPPPPPQPAPVAVELAFTSAPTDGYMGQLIAPIAVAARLASGQTDTAFAGDITLAVEAGGRTVTLAGTTTVRATSGLAVFSDLRVNNPGSGYRWQATSGALRSAFSAAFKVGTALPSLVYGSCLQWTWNEDFEDVCLNGGLIVLHSDGSEQVIPSGPSIDTDPAWSPEGTRITFTGYRHCGTEARCNGAIYVMNADGSGVIRLTPVSSGGVASYSPTWSPDGTRLAFNTWDGTASEAEAARLWVMHADGSNLTPLGNLYGSGPAWSPDGSRIAYTALDNSGRWAIHVASGDGSGPTPLTDPAVLPGDPANDFRPAWSPDGRRIVFVRAWQHPRGNGSCQVLVMNADGSNAVQLTQDGFCARAPAWSPDGARIAFTGTDDGQTWIKLMNPDGTGVVLLRRIDSDIGRVAWAPLR